MQEEEDVKQIHASVVDESALRDELSHQIQQELLAQTILADATPVRCTRCNCCPYGKLTAVPLTFGLIGLFFVGWLPEVTENAGRWAKLTKEPGDLLKLARAMSSLSLIGGFLAVTVNLWLCCKVFSRFNMRLLVIAYGFTSVTSLMTLIFSNMLTGWEIPEEQPNRGIEIYYMFAIAILASACFAGAAISMFFLSKKGTQV